MYRLFEAILNLIIMITMNAEKRFLLCIQKLRFIMINYAFKANEEEQITNVHKMRKKIEKYPQC